MITQLLAIASFVLGFDRINYHVDKYGIKPDEIRYVSPMEGVKKNRRMKRLEKRMKKR